MSEKQETVADILAEKRERADEIERDVSAKMASGEMVSDQYAREVIADLRMEADRIEAAWRRDIERERQKRDDAYEYAEDVAWNCAGNAAAMLKVLTEATILAKQLFTEAAENVNSESVIDTGVNKEAKPLRNCDVYRDYDSLHDAWVKSHGTGLTFGEWMFARATDNEGGKV